MSFIKSASVIGSVIFASLLMTTACNSQKAGQSAGIKPENLDTTAVPQNDFYQFATGGWQKANPLTGEYSRYGSFDKLAENNREQLKGLIEEIAAKPAAKAVKPAQPAAKRNVTKPAAPAAAPAGDTNKAE